MKNMFEKYVWKIWYSQHVKIEQNFWGKLSTLRNYRFASQASLSRNWGESHCCIRNRAKGGSRSIVPLMAVAVASNRAEIVKVAWICNDGFL